MTAFWSLVGVCISIAVFQAWREEHKKALARVGLIGRILSTVYFEGTDGRVGIVVKLQITNRGEPTVVDGWGMTFDLNGFNALPATHPLDGKIDINDNKGKVVRLKSSDLLHEKVGIHQIAKGGRVSGFLVFLTKGISYERLASARPNVTVLFRDAFGQEYTAMNQGTGIAAPMHEPGIDDPFAHILIRQAKEAKEGQKLLYSVVEKISHGSRPIMALIELGVADELDTNEDVLNLCRQLVTDGHGDPFEHLGNRYPPPVRQEFLKEARRKNLKFPNAISEVEFVYDGLRKDLALAKERMEAQKAED